MTEPVANDNPPPVRGGSYRVLLAVVIILGVLIIVAFGVLAGGLFMGLRSAPASGTQPWSYSLDIPAGTHVVGTQMEGDRILVHLAAPGSEDIVVFDAKTGKIVGRIQVKPPR